MREPALRLQESAARLEEPLLTLPGYVPKTSRWDAQLKERLVCWLERHARLSSNPQVQAKGRDLQRSRKLVCGVACR